MFSVTADLSIYPLSTLFDASSSSYVNGNRDISSFYSLSSVGGIDFKTFNFSNNIQNVLVDDEYTLFLSNSSPISSILPTDYASNSGHFLCNYSADSDSFIQKDIEYIDTQYMIILDNNLNVLPLKTFDNLGNYKYTDFKTYQKIYKKDKPCIQYKISSIPKILEPDTTTPVYNSYGVSSVPISSTTFITQGSIGGSCPLNSDMIMFSTSEYGQYSDLGDSNVNSVNNGTLLGLWLSSQTFETSSNKIWMERWYDPNTSDTDVTPFLHILSSDLNYMVDIPSTKVLSPKEKFEYVRHGPSRNCLYIENIDNNVLTLTSWRETFSQNSLSGYLTNFNGNSSYFDMNGESYGTVLPTYDMLIKNQLGFSSWIYSDKIQDSQIFGNYYNGYGYGISLNLGDSLDTITMPSASGNCFSINYRGFKIFEKDVINDLGLSAIDISYINTDLDGNAWLYDNFNKKIYKLENDDMISYQVVLPTNSNIDKIKTLSDNSFILLDTASSNISSFDSTGNILSSYAVDPSYTTFDIKSDDSIHLSNSEFILFDNFDRLIEVIGSSVYVNNNRILHLVDKPSSMCIDIDNYIWLLVGKNLLKIDVDGNVILDINLTLSFSEVTSTEMAFITNNKNGFNLWIIFNNASYVIIVDSDGNIVKRLSLSNMGYSPCSAYNFNIHGTFSTFDNLRKFNKNNNKVISSKNPALTLKISLKCGDRVGLHVLHTNYPDDLKWNNIAFSLSHKNSNTYIKLFVNGVLSASKTLNGIYYINYKSPSSPFIIGDYTGKLGPRNLEKSISKNNFFVGKISHLNLYNKQLSDFDIQALSRQEYVDWDGMVINIPIPPTTIIEDINKVNINRYKGYKTNKFNIIIKNFSSDLHMREYLEDYIRRNIRKWVPVNTSLNSIIFE